MWSPRSAGDSETENDDTQCSFKSTTAHLKEHTFKQQGIFYEKLPQMLSNCFV